MFLCMEVLNVDSELDLVVVHCPLQKSVGGIYTKALVLKHTYKNMFNSHNTQCETFHTHFCVACSKPSMWILHKSCVDETFYFNNGMQKLLTCKV